MNFKYKNSNKNNLLVNMLIIMISAVLTFMGAKMFGAKVGVVVFAIAIAVCFYKIAIEAIEKLISGKIHYTLVCLVSVLCIFASQKFLMSAIVAMIISLSMTIYDFINSVISTKLLENDANKLKYEVLVSEENTELVFADDLQEGDLVKVQKGDYLAFDYFYTDKKGVERKAKAGKFNFETDEETVVKVQEVVDYDIDFEESVQDTNSKVLKIVKIASEVYVYLLIAVAIVLCGLDFVQSKAILQSIYVLGVYLIFANPLVVNSGVLASGLISLKDLKQKGLCLESVSNLEKLSNVKKIYVTNELVAEETKVNPEVIKAVKIAEVLKIDTELLSDVDEEKTEVIAKTVGFKTYQSNVSAEDVSALADAPLKMGGSACVTSLQVECEKAMVISTDCEAKNHICKNKIFELAKAIKYSSFFKWFSYARVAVGAVVNAGVLALFASGKGANFIANKLVETDVETLKGKILTALYQYEMLTPWVICAVQLILINVLLFLTLAFLTDNGKKL